MRVERAVWNESAERQYGMRVQRCCWNIGRLETTPTNQACYCSDALALFEAHMP